VNYANTFEVIDRLVCVKERQGIIYLPRTRNLETSLRSIPGQLVQCQQVNFFLQIYQNEVLKRHEKLSYFVMFVGE